MPRRILLSLTIGLAVCATLVARTAAAQNIQVTAADPNTGAQGTTALVVKISGKNFAPGAKTDFFLSGTTNPAGVTVRGTQWISATEVDATIDIADTASLAYFDIKVTNTTGRSGKGSDMFNVVQKTVSFPPATIQVADLDESGAPLAIQSDGRAYDGYTVVNGGVEGAYINGAAGVELRLTTGARSMRFTLGTAIVQPTAAPPPYCVPSGTWIVHQVGRFSYNVANAAGVALGITAMGSSDGVPLVVTGGGTTAGYDVAAIINFEPDGADPRVANFTVQLGKTVGTTLSRTSTNTWVFEHDATDPVLLQCSVPVSKNRVVTYDVGYFQLPFSITVTCNLSGSSCH